jgi:cytochrome c553
MKPFLLAISVAVAAAVASGCANLSRSRDLGNPKVPPKVTAMQVCSNCHGIDGNSISPNFPRLAGQPKAYIVNELKGFQARHRSDQAGQDYMWGMAHNLTPEQIDGLAGYFSGQKGRPIPAQGKDVQRAEFGREIYEKGLPQRETPACGICHGKNGEGLQAIPRLASQHSWYVVKELKEYQETDARPGTPMKQVSHKMSPEEMQSVAIYVQSLP